MTIRTPELFEFWRWVEDLQAHPEIARICDIETNGLLDTVTQCHSLVIRDFKPGRVIRSAHTDLDIRRGLGELERAQVVVGHNFIKYDTPALQKLYPEWAGPIHIFDTQTASQLIWPAEALTDFDYRINSKYPGRVPKGFIGKHSLKAWGYRLNVLKGAYSESNSWETWTPEMQEYCKQDTKVTLELFKFILKQRYSSMALGLEMAFQEYIARMERTGAYFDKHKAEMLYAELCGEREAVRIEIDRAFPPKVHEEWWTPKVNNKTRGYVKGVPILRRTEIPFNPGSGDQIIDRLVEKYGWEPTVFAKNKKKKTKAPPKPSTKAEVLEVLPYPEAKLICKWKDINKVIGMLAEGPKSWLRNLSQEGKVHGGVITNGTVTGRCAHRSPNLGQVPRRSEVGLRCRECFVAPSGWYLVGVDASGLELRVMAHFMARYDKGRYRHLVLKGDVHTDNQRAFGLDSRDDSKTTIYAMLYGAGPVLLGAIKYPLKSEAVQRKTGVGMKAGFYDKNPALKTISDGISDQFKKFGYLRGIDGRRLNVRSPHSAVNLVFQSAGAVIVKMATVISAMKIEYVLGWEYGVDYMNHLHVHDEKQDSYPDQERAQVGGQQFVDALEETSEYLKLRCPMTGEIKIGSNWRETH